MRLGWGLEIKQPEFARECAEHTAKHISLAFIEYLDTQVSGR